MSRKIFAQVLVFVLLLLAFFGTPVSTLAGGVCGGAYVVESGETLDTIAARCGTTVSAINAANPGVSGTLYAGQVLTLAGNNNSGSISSSIYSSDYSNYNNYTYYAPVSYSGNYIVQFGDTFSGIASRYGISIYDLWAANPNIWNINFLYTGQLIYIPTSSGQTVYNPNYPIWGAIVPTATPAPVPLSYGTVPAGTPYGAVRLINKSSGDIYVSLQGTTRDGIHVINEYPVSGKLNVKVPSGWYVYVAWVGGQKFEGQFNLGQDSDHTLTFYSNKTVVE
jgi:LysM repeat protein